MMESPAVNGKINFINDRMDKPVDSQTESDEGGLEAIFLKLTGGAGERELLAMLGG